MNQNTHGGARPKVRDDDQRGKHHAPKPGSGRKPESFRLKLGDKLFVATKDADGNPVDNAQLWTVAEIDRNWLTINSDNGDTIRIRR